MCNGRAYKVYAMMEVGKVSNFEITKNTILVATILFGERFDDIAPSAYSDSFYLHF